MPVNEEAPRRSVRAFGGYELLGELGRGGMGVVYRARQLSLKRTVALKMLTGNFNAEDVSRFRAEAEMAAGLQHPNIVHIHEVGEEEGVPFFSMEFVEGGTLGDLLLKGLPGSREVAGMMMTLARAVHYAHRQGVVHRDLKPGNVLLGRQGEVKIADFGIAKRLDGAASMTLTGAVMGTPVYMAPEQAGGQSRNVGPAADVYALGALFYHLLTGRPPFLPEESDTALTLRVLSEDPVSPAWHRPEVPRDLETICLKALQKEPKDRYASADAMAEDLRRYLDDEPILAHPPTKIVRTVKWVKRHPWRMTVGLLLAALLGAGLQRWWQWEFHERPHVIWAWSLEGTNGLLEPKVVISEKQAAKLAMSFRLTRRGRHGPVTSVELLNSRRYPATVRRILGFDMMPNWQEGFNGAQNPDERAQETTKIEYAFSGDELREAVGLDRNHHVTWRMVQERKLASDPRSARVRFVNAYGFDSDAQRYATHAEFERNAAGKEVMVRFLTSSGQPAINREGVYGYKLERDARERVVAMMNLGRDDQPAANFSGMVAASYTWDEAGRITRQVFQDGKGQPMPWLGIAALGFEYDEQGNLLRLRRLDAAGKPCNGTPEAWSTMENQRNERGEPTEIACYKLRADATPELVSKLAIAYDEHGYPTDMIATTAQVTRRKSLYDERGNVVEERALDPEGKLRINPEGWAIRRSAIEEDREGRCWRSINEFFDEKEGKAWCKSGHHKEVITFDLSGQLRELDTFDHDPERFTFYHYSSKPEYNNEGKTVRLISRFEDAEGRPITGSETYSGAETEFDAAGNPVLEWLTGCDVPTRGGPVVRTEKQWSPAGKLIRKVREICDDKRQPLAITANDAPARVEEDYKDGLLVCEWMLGYRSEIHGAPSWRTDTEWTAQGDVKRRVREACDTQRQPIPMIHNGSPARTEEVYGNPEQAESLLETGFDPAITGFYSRVAKFKDGKFDSIVHALQDGTPVTRVRVFVKAVMDDAQAGSRQFHPGDQLVNMNSTPVTNFCEWVYGGGYTGGWIEIMRDGVLVRLDGFVPGRLGILLEERADPVR